MSLLDFECPKCGGTVTCELGVGELFVTLDYKCERCGDWCDVDIKPEAEQAKREAMEYFAERASELAERGQ